jgi:hypothetical protein
LGVDHDEIEKIERVVRLTLEKTPKGATHWSSRMLAVKTGLSQSTISRIWRAFCLNPHRTEGFQLSNDPLLIDKVLRCLHSRHPCTWYFCRKSMTQETSNLRMR